MTRRLLGSYLTITAFVLLILEIPLGITFQRSEKAQLVANLESNARILGSFSEETLRFEALDKLNTAQARELKDDKSHLTGEVHTVSSRQNVGVVVVDARGRRLIDSSPREAEGPDLSNQPEIAKALGLRDPLHNTQTASVERYSSALHETILYVAVPVVSGSGPGDLLGAVRLGYSVDRLHNRVRSNWLSLGLLAFVVLGAVAIVGSVLARSVTRPVRSLEDAVTALAGGDLAARAPTRAGPPEVRTLAVEFNDMARRLGELIKAQRSFVADASHELRTPLTALRLRLENLEYATPEELPGDIEVLSNEISRLSRLVEGLLALARADGQRPEREIIDVDDEVRQRAAAWEAFADEQAVHIETGAPTGAHASAVKGALAQVLDNYLANALEVSPPDATIEVSIEKSPEHVTVHVVDHGPGLGAVERDHAFDRFWRASGSTPGRGSGLGLAIVRQLVEASGGSARLDAADTGGVDAVVTLPAVDRIDVVAPPRVTRPAKWARRTPTSA
jgi:signal transduction histidine kinase